MEFTALGTRKKRLSLRRPLSKIRLMKLVEDYVPSTYSDLFKHYYPFMVALVVRMGIERRNAEDIASTILIKLIEKDALNYYNPEFVSEYSGVKRKAVFRTFLSGFVVSYVRYHKERQELQKYREPFSVNKEVTASEYTGSGEWLTVFGPSYTEGYEDLHFEYLVNGIKDRLKSFTPSSTNDKCNLPLLFDMILLQMEERGSLNVNELSELFDVSRPTVRSWINRLQSEIVEVL